MSDEIKRCPYCNEEINYYAKKCKHCGEWFEDRKTITHSSGTTIIEAFSTKYEILEEIGRGGMATVYKAKQKNLNRIVALKVIPKEFTHDTEFVTRFQREAQSAAKLNHHNIITIHDVGEIGGYPYIAMEYLEGGDLHQRIQKEGVLSEKETKKIILPIIDALGYAHYMGIIHRDIKSSNIMLGKKGRPVLMDFGIAKSTEGTKLTKTRGFMGTPEYSSPEQADSDQEVDFRTDIYSLGIVLYEMCTGRVPFMSDNPLSVLNDQMHKYPTNPKELNAKLTDGLVNILLKSISKQPDDRFQSCEVFAEALEKGEIQQAGKTNIKPVTKEQSDKTIKIKKKKREPKQQTSVFPKILFSLLLLAIIVIVGIIITNTQKHQEISIILQTAEVHFNNGSYDKAEERYYSVLEIDRGNEAAKTGLKLIETERRRQLELAEAEERRLEAEEQLRQQQVAEKLRKQKAAEKLRKQQKAEAAKAKEQLRQQQKAEAEKLRKQKEAEKLRKQQEAEKLRKQKAAEKLRREKAFFDNTPSGMIAVKGGTFQMGNNGGSNEKPVHEVYVSDFYIGKYEVTVEEFKEFIDAKGYKTDAEKKGYSNIYDGKWKKKNGVTWKCDVKGNTRSRSEYDHPVIHVSWNDADAYCRWKGGRLPTEAEWEYAARGGNKSRGYKYAGSNNVKDVAWYDGNSGSKTHKIGTKQPNELGIYDMSGNVWEWCWDWYDSDYYSRSPKNNPQGASSGKYSVLHGGCWVSNVNYCRVAIRDRFSRDYSSHGSGFRIARTP